MHHEQREMTHEEQVELWVQGQSIFNSSRNECCPDFSCCQPHLLWPKEMREMFRDHPERREAMLFSSLMSLIKDMGKEEQVYVAGKPEPDWTN